MAGTRRQPGDLGILNADGTLTLVGRSSNVINTGGEKVLPEEVDNVVISDGIEPGAFVEFVDPVLATNTIFVVSATSPRGTGRARRSCTTRSSPETPTS